MNSLFDLANKGIGNAYFSDEEYEQAMEYYEVARDQDGYSNAFWEVRNEMLLSSGGVIISIILISIALYFINYFTHFMRFLTSPIKKLKIYLQKYKLYQELVFPFYIFKHPGDGYYGIKRENKASNFTATIYLLLFFLAYVLWIYRTSFLFNNQIPSEINLFEQMVTIFVPFILWVVANYLVCSIRDGEGKFSDVYQASAYSLLPMIITFPIITFVSNGLTYNEAFIYDALLIIGLSITVIYFIIMVKEIHFYDMKPTIGNILISIFTAVMIVAVLFIVYLLLNEVYGLFSDIVRELINRG
jgi:tetratricopeptide (TPR) repeat protein